MTSEYYAVVSDNFDNVTSTEQIAKALQLAYPDTLSYNKAFAIVVELQPIITHDRFMVDSQPSKRAVLHKEFTVKHNDLTLTMINRITELFDQVTQASEADADIVLDVIRMILPEDYMPVDYNGKGRRYDYTEMLRAEYRIANTPNINGAVALLTAHHDNAMKQHMLYLQSTKDYLI